MPRVPCDEMALYNTALSLINLARLSRTSTLPAIFSETRDSVIFHSYAGGEASNPGGKTFCEWW